MATKTKSLPKSKARNAFDLLSEIAALTLEEPKRMRMGIWGGKDSPEEYDDLPAQAMPSCRTVGCIGGWVDTLKPRRPFSGARAVLGLNDAQGDQLFHKRSLVKARFQGTRGHARAVVAHIRRFQQQHATQLKAKRV